ncbi:MAG TPA: SIMPL domain-containing protein [Bryocella sp.]|nr:SIMPL domain-containing protein [Bryocella sp.]
MQKSKSVLLVLMFVLLPGLLAGARSAAAQEQRTLAATPNTVWVGADGKFESEPDTALVQFNISAQANKLQDANQQASQAADRVRQLLRSNGIEPQQAEISRFATEPVYDYNDPKRKLVGYRVEANISIKLKDFSKVGPIAEGLADLEVTNASINYMLENMDSAKIKAVQDALRRARDEANAVAQSSGRSLGELSYASVDTFEPQPIRPMPGALMMKAETAAPPPTAEFAAQKITVTAHVNALYNLK